MGIQYNLSSRLCTSAIQNIDLKFMPNVTMYSHKVCLNSGGLIKLAIVSLYIYLYGVPLLDTMDTHWCCIVMRVKSSQSILITKAYLDILMHSVQCVSSHLHIAFKKHSFEPRLDLHMIADFAQKIP